MLCRDDVREAFRQVLVDPSKASVPPHTSWGTLSWSICDASWVAVEPGILVIVFFRSRTLLHTHYVPNSVGAAGWGRVRRPC